MFNFLQYTVPIMYVHGSGSIFYVLNNSLQQATLPTLIINLITFFHSLKIESHSHHPPPLNVYHAPNGNGSLQNTYFSKHFTCCTFKGLHSVITFTQFIAEISYINDPFCIFSQM
jgi:hypothetical protein